MTAMHRLHRLTLLFRKSANPWMCALQLAAFNGLLGVLSGGTFVGGIVVVAWINQFRRAGHPAAGELPFPYPLLLILDAVIFIAASAWFARRFAPLPSREKWIAAALGISPILVLSLVGYVTVVVLIATGGNGLPAGVPWVYGAISTLILFAAVAELLLILLLSPRPSTTRDARAAPGER